MSTRYFSVQKMLRMTPNVMLREFFDHLGYQLTCIEWRRMPHRCEQALKIVIDLLPKEAQDDIAGKLAVIFELACPSGVQALIEAAKRTGRYNFVELLPQAEPYHQAMWAWLHFPGLFEHATLMHQVEHLVRGKTRDDMPRVEPRRGDEALKELATGISQFLRCEEGRGQHCTVEHFRRDNGTEYYVCYPDDFVQTIAVHDNAGTLQPQSIQPTFEIVFAYNQEEDTLNLFAKMPTPLKVKLECLFGQIILCQDIGPRRYCRPYDLNRLRDRYFCLETDAEDGLTACITKLRVDSHEWGKIALEPAEKGCVHDVYDMVDHCLDHTAIDWDEVDILHATFRFRFDSMRGRRAGSLEFNVTYPDHFSTRTQLPDRLELVHKYLKRWRIARV